MNEKTVVITEVNGKYRVENNGFSDFALLGILECIVFDMKNAKHELIANETLTVDMSHPIDNQVVVKESNAPGLRTLVANAIKAIKGLGGQTPDFDASNAQTKNCKRNWKL